MLIKKKKNQASELKFEKVVFDESLTLVAVKMLKPYNNDSKELQSKYTIQKHFSIVYSLLRYFHFFFTNICLLYKTPLTNNTTYKLV